MTNDTGNVIGQKKNDQDWYEIEVEGYFNSPWFSWLGGWEINPLPGGNTLLLGRVKDSRAHIRIRNASRLSP
jgi:hypothetical protein